MKKGLVVCIDTNVWLSGLIFGGAPAEVIDLAINKKIVLVASEIIIEETCRHLSRKFKLDKRTVEQFRDTVLSVANLYAPRGTIHVVQEKETDNLILETAILGGADFLVTGDKKHLLPIKEYGQTKIVAPATFLQYYTS